MRERLLALSWLLVFTAVSAEAAAPATPTNFKGEPTTSGPGRCPKTEVLWSWDSVAAVSTGTPRYELRRENGITVVMALNTATSFIDSGFTLNTSYKAIARSYDPVSGAYSQFTSTVTAWTYPVTVDPPNTLTGTPTSSGGADYVDWTWSAPPGLCDPWGYAVLDTHTNAYITSFLGTPTPHHPQGAPTDLGPNVIQSIKVLAGDSYATSGLSVSATAYSPARAPDNPSAASISTSSVLFSWGANGNPSYTRYEVELSTNGFATLVSTVVGLSADLTATSTPVTGLVIGTAYSLRVRAYNGRSSDSFGGVPTLSTSTSFTTLPGAPTLWATVLGPTSLQWNWSALPGATGYRLYDDGGSLLVDTAGLSYTSSSLTANNAYGAYLVPYNAHGTGVPSATVYAFTSANAPTALSLVTTSSSAVTYSWSGNGNPGYTYYEVNVATDPIFQAVIATRNATGTTLAVHGLFPGTTYHARLRAVSGSQEPTAYSLFLSTVTNADPQVSLSSPPASVYTGAAGLIGLWHLDEGLGTSAADASATNNAGALTCLANGCSSTPTFTGGPPDLGSAVAFPGTADSLVQVAHHASYAFTGSMSVSAWVKPATTALADGAGIVAKGDGGSESFALDVVTSGGQKRYRFISRPGTVAVATSTVRVGQWDHVSGVFDDAADETRIYVNGVLSATTASPLPRVSPAHALSIGARQSGSGSYDLAFAGSIDEVRLANKALSAEEVRAEFLGALPATFALPPPNDDVRLTFPPNAFGAPVVIYASDDPVNHPLRIGAADMLAGLLNTPTGQALAPGSLIEIVPTVAGAAFTGDLGSPATLSLPYPDSNGDGLVDGVNPQIAAGGLRVYTLNTTIGRWDPLATTVDRANKRASAPTPHFSVFALFGPSTVGSTLSQVRVYPVPWKPGSSGRFDAAALTFDLLPAEGSVRLFTLAGDQVVELPFSGSDAGRVTWNGRNAAGRAVASGVYFAYVRSARDGATRVLKFAVER